MPKTSKKQKNREKAKKKSPVEKHFLDGQMRERETYIFVCWGEKRREGKKTMNYTGTNI